MRDAVAPTFTRLTLPPAVNFIKEAVLYAAPFTPSAMLYATVKWRGAKQRRLGGWLHRLPYDTLDTAIHVEFYNAKPGAAESTAVKKII